MMASPIDFQTKRIYVYNSNEELLAIYKKAARIIKSCTTIHQLVGAARYVRQFKKRYPNYVQLHAELHKLMDKYKIRVRLNVGKRKGARYEPRNENSGNNSKSS